MDKVRQSLGSVRSFVNDVLQEMKKTTWPNRQELVESTVVVIVSILLLSIFIGVCDKVLVVFLKLLIPTG